MSGIDYRVSRTTSGLSVSGPAVDTNGSAGWHATELGHRRILLETEDSRKMMDPDKDGNGWSPIDIFADFVFGMHHRSWTGVVAVDNGSGVRKIYFSNGEIVFAASNVIDDRLGEIIYRQGTLTLDQLTDCSVQVSRTRKFGQILLQSGIFNNVQLWEALRAQVREIVQSIFTVEQVYFEMVRGPNKAPTEVVFTEGTRDFLESTYGYGCMFRDFASRIGPECQLEVVEFDRVRSSFKEGTFAGDFIRMAQSAGSVDELLRASKLTETNTLASLMAFIHLGMCTITPAEESKIHRDRAHLAKLKSKLDIYEIMLAEVQKAFGQARQVFPVADIRRLIRSVDSDRVSSFLLGRGGEITRDSVDRMFSQCQSTHGRTNYFTLRMDCLIQFLLQLTGDTLPYEVAKEIRGHYRKLIQ
jgi:hypothetical protein